MLQAHVGQRELVAFEIVNEQNKEFKIIEDCTRSEKCFATFVFRSGSKGTGTKNLTDHKGSRKDISQPNLPEIYS